MKKLLHDYGITQDTMCVFCDNTSAINLSKNLVQHSKLKHIKIRYHFIRDLVEEKIVYLEFINIDNQKADILLNLLMVQGLSPCVRPLVSVSSLKLYLICEPILFIIKHLVFRTHML